MTFGRIASFDCRVALTPLPSSLSALFHSRACFCLLALAELLQLSQTVILEMASPIASAALKARIKRPSMLKKLCNPEDLLQHFPNGAYIGWSGFTGVGYPK